MSLTPLPMIPVFQPHLGVDTLKAVTDAFHVGWIGMGSTTRDFEQALQKHLQTDRHVVATMTGSAALHLGLLLAGVSKGDEVILPSFNFIADVQAILWCGAYPVFCDIEPHALGLDADEIERLISPRTKAIMPLHFAGMACGIDAVNRVAQKHGLRVIEDATHALGTSHCGQAIGSFGDITCFSFDPVKIITCLDGGAVVCRREEDVARLHRLRLLGVDKDTSERYRNRRAWDYDVLELGHRCHMTNINAAIGLSQLARLDDFAAHRRAICERYTQAFADLTWLRMHDVDYSQVGPFIFTVRVMHGNREAFIAHLRSRGVDSGIHFMPCHTKTLCAAMRRGPLAVTDEISSEIVTLPLWSNMPEEVVQRVIEAVRSFVPQTTPATADFVNAKAVCR